MRISASGLLATIAVAIDQILRLAPSIRPPIEPVVSSTKATSTVGLAWLSENAAVESNAAAATTNARVVIDSFMYPPVFRPSEPRFHLLHVGVRSKTGRTT